VSKIQPGLPIVDETEKIVTAIGDMGNNPSVPIDEPRDVPAFIRKQKNFEK